MFIRLDVDCLAKMYSFRMCTITAQYCVLSFYTHLINIVVWSCASLRTGCTIKFNYFQLIVTTVITFRCDYTIQMNFHGTLLISGFRYRREQVWLMFFDLNVVSNHPTWHRVHVVILIDVPDTNQHIGTGWLGDISFCFLDSAIPEIEFQLIKLPKSEKFIDYHLSLRRRIIISSSMTIPSCNSL